MVPSSKPPHFSSYRRTHTNPPSRSIEASFFPAIVVVGVVSSSSSDCCASDDLCRTEFMVYTNGQKVEISKEEPGFEGSHHPATIKRCRYDGTFLVNYQTMLTDDFMSLREFVEKEEVRSVPPQITVDEYNIGSMVDANGRDGWWVGKVLAKVGDLYEAYFELTGEYQFFSQIKSQGCTRNEKIMFGCIDYGNVLNCYEVKIAIIMYVNEFKI